MYFLISDTNITCIETSSIDSNNILHKINCSFSFKADESCRVSPLWIDQKTKRNITEDEMDHSSGYNDGYMCLCFDGSSGITHVSRLGLGVFFDCSPNASSYYYDAHFIYDRHVSNYLAGNKMKLWLLWVILMFE